MIWKEMEKSCKWCVTSTTTKDFKVSLKFIVNSEEVILSELSVDLEEQREDNYLSLLDKYSYYLLVFICYHKFMLDSKTKNLDTEKDISIWLWTKNLDKLSSQEPKSSDLLEAIWPKWNSLKSKPQWWIWFLEAPLLDPSLLITMT